MFNSFLNIYLRTFYSRFPLIRTKSRKYNNNWITLGIKISCRRKRELSALTKNSDNAALKQYYKTYCRILTKVIREAKRMSLNKWISKSNNKIKTTWNTLNELLGKQKSMQGIQKLTIDFANAFNKYFSSVNSKSNSDNLENIGYNTLSTYRNFEQGKGTSAHPLVFKSFSTEEITLIIKFLKTKKTHLGMMKLIQNY